MPSIATMSFEERMRLVFSQEHEHATLTMDTEGRILDWSYGCQYLFGWTAEEAVHQSFSLIFTPEDISTDVPQAELKTALCEGRAADIRWHIRKDGSRFFADGAVTALRTPDGSVAGFTKSLREATETLRLRESEERFRSLVTASSQVVWRTEANGEVLHDSPSWRAFTGQSYDQWKGVGWLDAVHPEDRRRVSALWSSATLEGTIFEAEFRVRHVSGEYRWMLTRGVPIRDQSGAIREWIGTNTDVTEKKRIETELLEYRARMEAAFAAGDIGTFTWDLHTDLVRGDASMRRLHGVTELSAASLPVDTYFASIHPDDVPATKADIEHAIALGQAYHVSYRVCLPNGGVRFIHTRGGMLKDENGATVAVSGVGLDISALKEAEIALSKREERYQALFNTVDEGFYIIELIYDEQGEPIDYRFLEANPAAGRLNGLQDVVGKTLREVIAAPTLPWLKHYDLAAKTGIPQRFLDYSKPVHRWFDISVTRVGTESTHQVALLFSDITERKQREEELQHLAADLAQTNRRQEEFLATLAHELRNPLAPIRAGLDLIDVSMDLPPLVSRVHSIMNRQVSHLTHLVDDLMDLARVNSGKIQLKLARHSLQDIVRSAIDISTPAITAKRHDLAIQMPSGPIWIDGDLTRLGQVFSNLLTNAAKYTPEHGRIVLSVEQEDDSAVVRITDTGIGLATEDQAHVFDMFSQIGRGKGHSQGGLGIGLNLVKRLTEKHGGTATVSSPGVDGGSTFTVRLPVVANCVESDRTSAIEAAADEAATYMLNVVIADDNRDAAELLEALLEVHGHNVTTANDGIEALNALRSRRPDLALLDIGMPGLSGYEVAKAVRADPQLQDIVLVALTGWNAPEDRSQSEEAGFDDHLPKPVSSSVLMEVIAKVKELRAEKK